MHYSIIMLSRSYERTAITICLLGLVFGQSAVKSAFLNLGVPCHHFYVVPPHKFNCWMFHCILLSDFYQLLNANAKCQPHYDRKIVKFSLKQVLHIPQLFYLLEC